MSSSLRRGALAGAAIVFSIASLSACGAGNDAQTLGVRPDNAATAVDNLKLQNVNVITQPKPDVKGPAVVALTIFNDGVKPQTLESITLPGSDAKVKLTPAKGSKAVTVPAQGRLIIGGKDNASAVIENGNQEMNDGSNREVVFRFSETGDITLRALVVPATNYFKDFGPTEVPKPKPSPAAPTTSPSGSPSGAPTGTPASPEAPEGDTEAAGSEPELPTDSASASHSAGH
ncbi:DUF461 domain-containing protein [Streptomyces sp. Tu 2975]|uniref:DUF461 domain-containing protein n=1 Tax=Streptomyces sp. Tu 2975 TaxID=2676871 RepID=UPI00135BA32D|nr:DUF461 domain-containing protein [Streptomyces sp. Tu 2975]QIP85840.1 DUF461 domain-containing protein [Streptomyces sp. Tu 2975]